MPFRKHLPQEKKSAILYPMTKPVILTGIRANNDLTLGNFFGAIRPMIDMATRHADHYQINLFVPDLHSFTTPIDHSKLQAQIMHNLRLFTAAGLPLDKPDIHIYRQSYIPAHSELTWILDCFTGFGEMSRMTQFKDKSRKLYGENSDIYTDEYRGRLWQSEEAKKSDVLLSKLEQRISVGLFNYPVLMAADILLYHATYVPVGDDQTQHLEFARDIATRMNKQFGKLFTVPKPVKQQHVFFGKEQGLRIKDLAEPTKKMSKSDKTSKGVIFLGDKPEEAAKKVMSATTDSVGIIQYDWDNQPGITNLLQILALLSERKQDEVNAEWVGKPSYGDLKKAVAAAVRSFLETLQTTLAGIDDAVIKAKLVESEAAMDVVARHTLEQVQKAVGLRS